MMLSFKACRAPVEMDVIRTLSSSVGRPRIDVEFVVLHYTVENLEDTLRLCSDPASPVSAHLVVSEEGAVHEIVPCWDGVAYRAGHAGLSRWVDEGEAWENFNDFSLGIEIVNRNGNVFPFTEAQYATLAAILLHLKERYTALHNSRRLLGHEQISGWRGKVDPGRLFNWGRVSRDVYPEDSDWDRSSACPDELAQVLATFVSEEPSDAQDVSPYWRAINRLLEASVALISAANSTEKHP
jgi:N-acetyl-anhydromuramyl-L-alanine amidase AmpD